ncbi:MULTISPECIES: site-specific integrase [Bradyrhizobium]|uniref:site-specific integrase n=1 Tax=Bradyrhizobium TaxID=374 RepID=UPI00214FAE52|nr:site-specific integrase [Bradyrhizobium diazoefficiens]MDC8020665.1 site-specific integrase [Bradyrhizobium diazoefficiens]MDK4221452.1 site-specific integrase [Bradyrhizobium diazoefficiens]WRJ02634.1 site-specific integrase [Bradyrhizobium diazoefficiens]WRJ10880.1 site-specific integrase [Bradyrhizobium diazoefficiens]WRJ19151.1 site-specific integrase [Bradyrhizobium diazoefficiens]
MGHRHTVLDPNVDGFSGWVRDAIKAAGIMDLRCQPHGLRRTFGRLLADAGATAREIMAAMGHLTLGITVTVH